MGKFRFILATVITLNLPLVFVSAQPTNDKPVNVSISNGDIKGVFENGVYVWKGIPYAEAPIGNLRYRNPEPKKSWVGTFDATQFKAVCPQAPGMLTHGEKQNEDCLFLNVWTPAADNKKRPVMFWIHGGGFMSGSGSSDLYDGAILAKKGDVVVVTINYRLAPLGLLYFKNIAKDNEGFQNNLAIKDQIMALNWVKDNIESFGGDPNMVTIFGESAGARSVLALLGAPSAKGLFKRAIAQSATPDFSWSPEQATAITKTYLDILRIPQDSLEKLRSIPVDTLLKAINVLDNKLVGKKGWNRVFTPTIDNEKALYASSADDKPSDVDLLIGTNMDESNLFTTKQMGMIPRKEIGLKPYFSNLDSLQVIQVTGSYKSYPRAKAIHRLLTDAIFRIPSIEYADRQSRSANVYMYRFDWCSFPLKMVGLRSFHGLEMPFIFGNYKSALAKKMLVMASKKKVTSLSEKMQQAWINFARTGNPNTTGINTWQNYTSENRATWIFNSIDYLAVDPDSLQRKAWIGIDFQP
jgi:para-nitrobenzyl esterase